MFYYYYLGIVRPTDQETIATENSLLCSIFPREGVGTNVEAWDRETDQGEVKRQRQGNGI